MNFLMYPLRQLRDTLTDFPGFMRQLVGAWEQRARAGDLPIVVPARQPWPAGPGWTHCHAMPELFFQLRGANHFQLPRSEIESPSGTLALMPRFTAHKETRILEKRHYAHVCMSFADASLGCHFSAYPPLEDGRKFIHVALRRHASRGPFILQTLDELSTRPGHVAGDRIVQSLVITLLAHIRECIEEPPVADRHPLVTACQSEILRRLQDPALGIAQLADSLRCHPDHLSRLYHRECGIHLRDYIIRQRILLAEQLLVTTSMPVGEVARASGYTEHAYFSRQFRERKGASPGAFRAARGFHGFHGS